MPRGAGYRPCFFCWCEQARSSSPAERGIAPAVSGRSMPRPYGLSRLTDQLHQRLEQPWLLVWTHPQDAMLAGR